MTRYTPQWIQAGTYAGSQDRRLIGALWPLPASNGCQVTTASGMSVNISPGQVAVPTSNNTGSTLCSSDAVETVTLTAAPPSGQSRYDLIICRPRANDIDGGVNNDFIFDFVTGTAATTGSQVVPATPAGTACLAQILIPGASASITQANITSTQPWGLATGGAGSLPTPLAAGAPFTSFTDTTGEAWVAKGGVNNGSWRRARDILHGRWSRAASWTTNTSIAFGPALDTTQRDIFGMLSGGKVVIPLAGMYLVRATLAFNPAAAGSLFGTAIGKSGVQGAVVYGYSNAASQFWDCSVSDTVPCAVNDTLEVWNRAATAYSNGGNANEAFMAVDYLGSG